MSIYSIQPLVLGAVRTYPLVSRKSKVGMREFARASNGNISLSHFLDSLPQILAARDLRELLGAILAARQKRKAILWGMGGHVIKVGLDRKSTRLNSSHSQISYAVFCLKKKNQIIIQHISS